MKIGRSSVRVWLAVALVGTLLMSAGAAIATPEGDGAERLVGAASTVPGTRIQGTLQLDIDLRPPEILRVTAIGPTHTKSKLISADGSYDLGPLVPGEPYKVYFSRDDLNSRGAPFYYDDVPATQPFAATEITLAAGETTTGIDATMTAGARIKGSALKRGQTNGPYNGYNYVDAYGWIDHGSGSGEWGWFGYARGGPNYIIRGLPPGEYVLFRRVDVAAEYYGRAFSPEDAKRITLPGDGASWCLAWATPRRCRAGGADRYETAVRAADRQFENRWYGGTEVAVVASGEGFADGLAASGIAGCFDAPILLSQQDEVPAVTLKKLHALGTRTIYVVGGPAAVGDAVVATLTGLAGVERVIRIAGPDRYATAVAVAEAMEDILGDEFASGAFLVRGDLFPDAVSVSPYAFSQHMPVLLTRPDSLDQNTRAAIESMGFDDVYIAGGPPAVSTSVSSEVDSIRGGAVDVTRLAGSDRYATAYRVADYALGRGWAHDPVVYPNGPGGEGAPHVYVGLATGENYPDALAGGPVVGRRYGCLILTRDPWRSTEAEEEFLAEHGEVLDQWIVLGDEGVVPEESFARFLEAVGP